MNEKDKTFFWAGTLFLYIAMVILTVAPKLVIEYFPSIYINIQNYRSAAIAFFTLALALYFLSKSSYKNQLIAIALSFVYFYTFCAFNG